jgi:hypothetical protein
VPTRGIFITALGERHRAYAKPLVLHLGRVAPSYPVIVLTDAPADFCPPAQAVAIPFGGEYHSGQRGKLLVSGIAPWDEVLLVDADYVPRDLGGIWNALRDDCPCIPIDQITPNVGVAWYATQEERQATLHEVPRDFPHFNTGIFAYRRTAATMIFFRDWQRLASEMGGQDEPPLARLLVRKGIRPPEMPATYSMMPREDASLAAIMALYRANRGVHLWGNLKRHLEELYREISA